MVHQAHETIDHLHEHGDALALTPVGLVRCASQSHRARRNANGLSDHPVGEIGLTVNPAQLVGKG